LASRWRRERSGHDRAITMKIDALQRKKFPSMKVSPELSLPRLDQGNCSRQTRKECERLASADAGWRGSSLRMWG
jgi:hypothetical protein